jgi:hypothetical protein
MATDLLTNLMLLQQGGASRAPTPEEELMAQFGLTPAQPPVPGALPKRGEMTEQEKALAAGLSPDGMARPQPEMGMVMQDRGQPVTNSSLFDDRRTIDREYLKRAIMRQQSGVEEMRSNLRRYSELGMQPDFRPLAAVLDSAVKGGKLAESLPRVETPEERSQMILKLQNAIQEQEDKATGQVNDALAREVQNRLAQQQMRQNRFDQSHLFRVESAVQGDIEKAVLKPVNEISRDLGTIEANLARGDVQGLYDSASAYARSVQGQKGVLTDKDIAMAMPASLMLAITRAEAYLKGDRSINIDKEVLTPLRQGVAVARDNLRNVYSRTLDTKERQYRGRQSTGMLFSEGGSGPELFGAARDALKTMGQPVGAPAAGAGAMPLDLQAQAKAILEQRKAKP